MCTLEERKENPFKLIEPDWQYWFLNLLKTPALKSPWELHLEAEERAKIKATHERDEFKTLVRRAAKPLVDQQMGVIRVTF
jgi:hypothetical protein